MSKVLSLEPFHITRPEKIRWRAFIHDKEILDTLKSSSLKSFLAQADEVLKEQHLAASYHALTKEQYMEWLTYYQENMTRHGYDVIATAEWYDSRQALGRVIEGMFIEQQTPEEKKLVASGIFTRQDQELATFAFKASERIKLTKDNKGTVGALLDYLFLREMKNNGVKNISAGRSRNAFNVFNTIGYLSYSLRFGFVPSAAENVNFVNTVPLGDDETVLFYGVKNNIFTLFNVKQSNAPTQTTDFAQLSAPEVPYEELTYTEDQILEAL